MRSIEYSIRKCEKCGNDYSPRSSTQSWCDNCLMKPCIQCGKLFHIGKRTKIDTAKFCSRECKGKYNSKIRTGENAFHYKNGNRIKVNITCDVCGNAIKKDQVQIKTWEKHFCSRKCQAKYYQENSGAFSGENSPKYNRIEISCEWCGKTFKTWPSAKAETRFCSKQCRNNWQSDMMKGENHYNWQGGKSEKRHIDMSSREYKEWRHQVFKRDKYTCQVCGDKRGGNLRLTI